MKVVNNCQFLVENCSTDKHYKELPFSLPEEKKTAEVEIAYVGDTPLPSTNIFAQARIAGRSRMFLCSAGQSVEDSSRLT